MIGIQKDFKTFNLHKEVCHLSTIVLQNKIVLPTTAPVSEQRDALFRRVGEMVEAAGRSGVNVLCLQEAWSEFDPSR